QRDQCHEECRSNVRRRTIQTVAVATQTRASSQGTQTRGSALTARTTPTMADTTPASKLRAATNSALCPHDGSDIGPSPMGWVASGIPNGPAPPGLELPAGRPVDE